LRRMLLRAARFVDKTHFPIGAVRKGPQGVRTGPKRRTFGHRPQPAAPGRGRVKTADPAGFRQPDVEICTEGWRQREFRALTGCARSAAVSRVLGRAGRADSRAKKGLHPQQAFRVRNIWPIPRICITRLRLYASTCRLISVRTRARGTREARGRKVSAEHQVG
jgi:hypothetical protein